MSNVEQGISNVEGRRRRISWQLAEDDDVLVLSEAVLVLVIEAAMAAGDEHEHEHEHEHDKIFSW
jgi:hypothetical protein